jgi:RNA polymerase sigma factor (sigma-70 family)
MAPTDDSALLRQFTENHSDEAFAALVTRHINLVYSVALRQVGNPHAAEEITQAVFIIMVKKAVQLRHDKALSSWLFQATRLTANNFIRSESRRRHREEEAYMQSVLNEAGTEVWPRIAPLLDSAVAGLREKDRRAIVLRFYEGRNLREVGLALGASEDAAEKRVSRALEKLRQFFTKRGVDSTAATIAGAISANSVQAAPVALAKSVTAVVIAKGAAASGSTLTLIKGALKIMAWTKAKTVVVTAAVVLLAAGTTTTVVVKEIHSREKQMSWAKPAGYPGDWIWNFDSRILEQVPPIVILRPTQMPSSSISSQMFEQNRYIAVRRTIPELLAAVYSQKDSGAELKFLAPLPDDKFDCIVVTSSQSNWPDALLSEINKRFNLVEQWGSQTGTTAVFVKKAN